MSNIQLYILVNKYIRSHEKQQTKEMLRIFRPQKNQTNFGFIFQDAESLGEKNFWESFQVTLTLNLSNVKLSQKMIHSQGHYLNNI